VPAESIASRIGARRGLHVLRRGGTGHYVLRRLGFAVGLIVVALSLNFVLIHSTPGDPVTLLAGESADSAYYRQIRASLGLDQPLTHQYVHYLLGALHGDLGTSITYRAPVLDVIGSRVPPTLLLMTPAVVIATVLGVLAGVAAGRRAGSRADEAISAGTLIGASIPSFWVGQLLVAVVSVRLDLLPAQGMSEPRGGLTGWAHVADVGRHLILPVATLTLVHLTLIARLVRTSMSDALEAQYIRTARAKGLPPRAVVYRHGLRNALLPVTTVVGTQFGALLGGAVLTETIFSWPGVGRLLYEATLGRDYPLLLGIFLVASVAIVLANLVTDLVYLLLDPRVSYQ
jgi:peptide/nickel transport system permease protein